MLKRIVGVGLMFCAFCGMLRKLSGDTTAFAANGDTVRGVVTPEWQSQPLDTTALPDGVAEFPANGRSCYLNIANHPDVPVWSEQQIGLWRSYLGHPEPAEWPRTKELLFRKDYPEYFLELYRVANGPGTYQKTLLILPHRRKEPLPVVVYPYYYPAQLLGFDPETGAEIPEVAGDEQHWKWGIMLAQAGFAVLSAEAYHITMLRDLESPGTGSHAWQLAAERLLQQNPHWSGVGKLVHDTQLMVDLASEDPRLDRSRISVMGHSLGGKTAFYTGVLDPRIRNIVASDWGIGWSRTNWDADWYWGKKLPLMKRDGLDHSQLLAASGTPLLMFAGKDDDQGARAFLDRAARQGGKSRLIVHGTGHRIPPEYLPEIVDFLNHSSDASREKTGPFRKGNTK